jgi:hypothetical protein
MTIQPIRQAITQRDHPAVATSSLPNRNGWSREWRTVAGQQIGQSGLKLLGVIIGS